MKLGTCCALALLTPLAWGTCPEYRTESYRDASGFRGATVGERPFFKPGVVVTDTLGNIYAADTLTDRIWRIAPAGSVELFAGSGPAGFDGDGKRAPQTQFNRIDGLAVSPAGELFIADRDNHRIRKITTAGLVITVAGTGTSSRGGESQPATATPISAPTALAFDNQNRLLFLEIALDPVIAGASDVEVSIAVDGVASNTVLVNFGERPRERVRERLGGVAVEANGDLLFSSSSVLYRLLEHRLVGVAAGTPGFPGTEGDEGLALLARLLEPTGIAVSPNGEIAIADAEANRVRIVRGDFTIATIPFVLSNPGGVAFGPDGTLYVADTGNNRILRRTAAGDMTTLVREGLSQPGSVAVAGDGSLLVADTGNRRIVRIVDGAIVPVPETDGTEWQRPVAVAAGDAGTLYVADAGARQVVKIDAEGVRAAAGEYEWSEPVAVAIGKDGALYVADRGAGRIVAVTAGGTAVTLVGPPE